MRPALKCREAPSTSFRSCSAEDTQGSPAEGPTPRLSQPPAQPLRQAPRCVADLDPCNRHLGSAGERGGACVRCSRTVFIIGFRCSRMF